MCLMSKPFYISSSHAYKYKTQGLLETAYFPTTLLTLTSFYVVCFNCVVCDLKYVRSSWMVYSPEIQSMHQELTTHTHITQDATQHLKKTQNTNVTDHHLDGFKLATVV